MDAHAARDKAKLAYNAAATAAAHLVDTSAWLDALAECTAHASRLPCVTRLHLGRCIYDAKLLAALLHFGPMTNFRVTQLSVDGAALTQASGLLVHLAFPHLQELQLGAPHPAVDCNDAGFPGSWFDDAGFPGSRSDHAGMVLEGDVFGGWQDGRQPTLTKLTVRGKASPAALLSLGLLTALQHLEVDDKSMPDPQSGAFTGLTLLQHLSLTCHCTTSMYLLDCAAEFALTKLTHVDVPLHSAGWNSGPEATPASKEGAVALVASQALALMANLRSLRLSSRYAVGDVLFDGLRRLTQLTQLHVWTFDLSSAEPGHLPALQHLCLHKYAPAPQLLDLLRPLLPLPSLTQLSPWRGCVELCAGCGSASDDEAMAALAAAAQCLADAPLLHLHTLGLHTDGWKTQLSHAQLALCLRPLAASFTSLHFQSAALGKGSEGGWDALGAVFTRLSSLSLTDAVLGEGEQLVDLVEKLPALQRLRMDGVEFDLSLSSWYSLARDHTTSRRRRLTRW